MVLVPSYSLQDIKTPSVTKYHNKYILKSTRKKNTAKGNTNTIINTRIRSSIKEMIRNKNTEEIIKKEKYNIIRENTSISGLSSEIFRDKNPSREDGRKMMMRMIHGTLPTCEKINRLVEVEKLSNNNGYYQTKYQKHTNEGLCPCCGQAEETVKHLFFECENNQIEEISRRSQRPYKGVY